MILRFVPKMTVSKAGVFPSQRNQVSDMNFAMPLLAANLLLQTAQIPVLESADFSKERQVQAITATVRIRNLSRNSEGTGSLVGKSGQFVYVLTAHHVVQGGERLEVVTFSKDSYPRPMQTYRDAEITAESPGLADLAIVRIRTADAMPNFLRICPEKKVPEKAIVPLLTIGCEGANAPTPLLEKQFEMKNGQRPGSKEISSFWVIDGKYAAGRSGGPLLDKEGRLLGVCSGTNRDKTYFTHTDEIHRFLKKNGYRWLAGDMEGK